MSDYSEDDGDLEFEYESDCFAELDESTVQIDNKFFEADDKKISDPAKAVESFRAVIELERDRECADSSRVLKSYQHIVLLELTLGNRSEALSAFKSILAMLLQVSNSEALDCLTIVLESLTATISGGVSLSDTDHKGGQQDAETHKLAVQEIEDVYKTALSVLANMDSPRLWLNTLLKLGRIYMLENNSTGMRNVIRDIHKSGHSVETPDKLELQALEIKLCLLTRNYRRLKQLSAETQSQATVAEPGTVAVITEATAFMHVNENNWTGAYSKFLEAFKSYFEAGLTSSAKHALKLVVLSNIMCQSTINPFDTNEARAFQQDSDVAVMQELRMAFDRADISSVHKLVDQPVFRDPLIAPHVIALVNQIRLKVLRVLLQPYSVVTFEHLCGKLNLSPIADRMSIITLLVKLSHEDGMALQLDEMNGLVRVQHSKGDRESCVEDISVFTSFMKSLHVVSA